MSSLHVTFLPYFSPSLKLRRSTTPNLSPHKRQLLTKASLTPSSTRRSFLRLTSTVLISTLFPSPSHAARPEGVNRPDLLPKTVTPVLDYERYLPSNQESRLITDINNLEQKTGIRIRILTQRYPQTPGKAIVDYWGVDDHTVVMVADYFGGNSLLKINVGKEVYNKLPQRFWSLLAAKYGGKYFVEESGEGQAITQSFGAIRDCLYKGGCQAPP